MKIKIPYDLRLKFLSLEGLEANMETVEVTNLGGKVHRVPVSMDYTLQLDLSNEPDLLMFCLEWIDLIESNFRETYKALKINIGAYTGLWPSHTINNSTIHFRMDKVDVNKKDWKDWFVLGDIEYASE